MVPTRYPLRFSSGMSLSTRVVFPEFEWPTIVITGGMIVPLTNPYIDEGS